MRTKTRNFGLALSVRSFLKAAALASTIGLLVSPAGAASLQEVSDWDKTGLPADVSMYSYVPDQVVATPPIVVLIHYCGGTAPAVFGQAQGGGLVQAADDYGFVIIAPSSGRCWDIVSDQTRMRYSNSDSHAIVTMVSYAVDKLGGNPNRVYATGDSSGGMMTQLLLGLYPEVFKGGSAMAGMPAACRGDGESGNGGGYSNACAGGSVDRTPEQWGQIVRSLSPEHSGLRPRVQIFHGDGDTIISYKNHTESIDEWTNVLGLSLDQAVDQNNIMVGDHQGTRKTWEGECGLPVLDALTSLGGDHGPSDALFLSQYLVPFLGLDEVGAVDPYVAACETQGTGGAGSGGAGAGGSDGLPESGGASGSGGSIEMGTGGLNAGGGGTSDPGLDSGGAPSTSAGGASGTATESGGAASAEGNGSDAATAGPRPSGCVWTGGAPDRALSFRQSNSRVPVSLAFGLLLSLIWRRRTHS